MEPKVRHADCPDVHIGVCAKCRRLYERGSSSGECEGRSDKAKAREQVDPPAGGYTDEPPQLKASRGGKRVDQPLTPAERQAKRRALLKANPVEWRAYLDSEARRKAAERERKRK